MNVKIRDGQVGNRPLHVALAVIVDGPGRAYVGNYYGVELGYGFGAYGLPGADRNGLRGARVFELEENHPKIDLTANDQPIVLLRPKAGSWPAESRDSAWNGSSQLLLLPCFTGR